MLFRSEYLLAFSCKCRYFCPSCHAKRFAIWTQWLDTTLLAPVAHRQVVLTIPKRLRAYCLYRRRLLGEIARVAARTVTAAIRTLTAERDLAERPAAPGSPRCIAVRTAHTVRQPGGEHAKVVPPNRQRSTSYIPRSMRRASPMGSRTTVQGPSVISSVARASAV